MSHDDCVESETGKCPYGYSYDALSLGQSFERDFHVTKEKVVRIAEATEDCNPLHLDALFAKETIFEGCIAHGVLVAGFISAVLGCDLPGGGWAVYEFERIRFRAPVRVGDTVRVKATVLDKTPRGLVRFSIQCFVLETCVVKTEATLFDARLPR